MPTSRISASGTACVQRADERDRAAASPRSDVSAPQAAAIAVARGRRTRARRVGGEAVAGRARAATVERDAERPQRLEVADDRGLRLGGVLLGVDADVELRARVRR